MPGAAYKKGDVIRGKYEVYGVLGKGGFGIVYLVYSRETKSVYALKTFRDEHLADAHVRERFRKEANVWVELERHPYLVRAYLVDSVAGRLFIAMEYIAPDEQGLNTLEGYLRQRPPDLAQSLRWAIQFCYGMEYAYSKGVRCHRDIKPANIMIGSDKAVRITDFGLAGVLGPSEVTSATGPDIQHDTPRPPGLTMAGTSLGTPTHMPPEQFVDAASCDERSDIYSFGVVLFQMSSDCLPFLARLPVDDSEAERARFTRDMYRLHALAPVPRQDSPLFRTTQRCLEKEPRQRYESFAELRRDLEPMLMHLTGEAIATPGSKELEAWEWGNKGVSLGVLGRDEEALRCYSKGLELSPENAAMWYNKAHGYHRLGHLEEAVCCYDRALAIEPRYASAWYNKGCALRKMGRFVEACSCHGRATEIDPCHAQAWFGRALNLGSLGRYEEAIPCCDRGLELNPRDTEAWFNRGTYLAILGRREEALRCFDKAVEMDPQYAEGWFGKAGCEESLGRKQNAMQSYEQCIAHAPARSADYIVIAEQRVRESEGHSDLNVPEPRGPHEWHEEGYNLNMVGSHEEALRCYDRALELDPRYVGAYCDKGDCLADLDRHNEALACYERALELDDRCAVAWLGKGRALERLGRAKDAVLSYKQFIALASDQDPQVVAYAQQRIRELEGK